MRLFLIVYNILLIIIMPFFALLGYIVMRKKGKEQCWLERFGFIKTAGFNPEKSIWFHCASVGETRSIKPLVDYIRQNYKDFSIIVSTMTYQGRKTALDYIKADKAFLLPLENSNAFAKIISYMKVKLVVIIDTELWPNLIYNVSSYSSLFLVNGRISDKTIKTYEKFSFLFRPLLKRFSCIMTKSQLDTERFIKILKSDKNIITAGNIKFQRRKDPADVKLIDELKNTKFFLMASTHAKEEEEIFSWFDKTLLSFDKIVIAPRHIDRCEEIYNLSVNLGYKTGFYSRNQFESDVLIIDIMGKLEGLYILADKIFIGGSLEKIGGHNIYEALQFEKETAVGRYMFSFSEIYNLAKKYNLVYEINSKEEALNWLNSPKEDKHKNFVEFFKEIDTQNNNTIDTITDIISVVMNEESEKR